MDTFLFRNPRAESAQREEEPPALYALIVDEQLQPCPGLRVEVASGGLRLTGLTDVRGVLFLDWGQAGQDAVDAGGQSVAVYTLPQSAPDGSLTPGEQDQTPVAPDAGWPSASCVDREYGR
jgi:hypothetical protein